MQIGKSGKIINGYLTAEARRALRAEETKRLWVLCVSMVKILPDSP